MSSTGFAQVPEAQVKLQVVAPPCLHSTWINPTEVFGVLTRLQTKTIQHQGPPSNITGEKQSHIQNMLVSIVQIFFFWARNMD